MDAFPEVTLALRELSASAQMDGLEARTLDIAIVREPLDRPEVLCRTLFLERLIAVLPHSLVSPSRTSVRLGELAPENFVLFDRSISPAIDRDAVACARSRVNAGS